MLPGLDTLHLTSHKLPMKQDKQTTYDIAYLKMAREWSKLSYCKRKIKALAFLFLWVFDFQSDAFEQKQPKGVNPILSRNYPQQ